MMASGRAAGFGLIGDDHRWCMPPLAAGKQAGIEGTVEVTVRPELMMTDWELNREGDGAGWRE